MKVLIGILGTISGILFGYFGFKRNQNNDLRQETREDASIKTTLDTKVGMILDDVKEVKILQRSFNEGFDKFKLEMVEKVARIDESNKQAHKRLDTLEKGK